MIESTALAASNSSLVDRFRERLGDAHDGVRMTALEGTGAIMQSAIQQGPPFWIFCRMCGQTWAANITPDKPL